MKSPEIITVKNFQKTIGYLAIFLALFLMLANILVTEYWEVQPSISHYYYTPVRDLFIGNLFVVAVFLYFYKGNGAWDNRLTNIASYSAFVVALVPTYFDSNGKYQQEEVSFLIKFPYHEHVHLAAAGVFLLALALLSLTSFPQTNLTDKELLTSKIIRNRIYYLCGWSIIVFVVLDGLALYYRLEQNFGFPFVFVCEAVALICFGVSWLTKGGVLFQDKND